MYPDLFEEVIELVKLQEFVYNVPGVGFVSILHLPAVQHDPLVR